jgi:hypothetical protein
VRARCIAADARRGSGAGARSGPIEIKIKIKIKIKRLKHEGHEGKKVEESYEA